MSLGRTAAGLLPALLALPLLGGCGSGSSEPELIVFAASSLQPAFESYADEFDQAEVEFSFAGSDALAAQIRQGLEPDVFAAADMTYPQQLQREGLVRRPLGFATNELVLAVPAGSGIESLAGAGEPGVSIAIGAGGVPVGDYTLAALERLPDPLGEAIAANVDSEEPDVAGIVAKLTQGAVDAGFVYRSDVATADGELSAIALPAAVAPAVAYGAAVGTGAAEPGLAQQFVDGLLEGAGAEALAASGFGAPDR